MMRRRALVTGSARGIGAAIAARLQAVGCDVIGVDVAESAPTGTWRIDLASWDGCIELARAADPVDILVNNAAILIEKATEDVTREDFERMTAVNLRAPFLLSRELGRGMQTRRFGRIINISSVGARTGGLSASAVYASTKAGLLSLTKHFARTYAPCGITVNAVAPGAIDTPMSQGQRARDPDLEARLIRAVPVGRWGTPDEVAAVVEFLASEPATFITGATIDVNGGWVMF
jgi:NAD(P)-dependent dehydrogenase (short-subunit alcohol dehydrogenase family)